MFNRVHANQSIISIVNNKKDLLVLPITPGLYGHIFIAIAFSNTNYVSTAATLHALMYKQNTSAIMLNTKQQRYVVIMISKVSLNNVGIVS